MYNLDLKDKKLLYELDCNSRQTIQQLARKIGLSKDAIKYRINRILSFSMTATNIFFFSEKKKQNNGRGFLTND